MVNGQDMVPSIVMVDLFPLVIQTFQLTRFPRVTPGFLQGSPAHPSRIASHPHLARLYERCTKHRSFPLIQSATGSEDEAIQYSRNFGGRKLGELMKNTIFAKKSRAECSLLPRQGCHAPKFRGKKFHEEPQNDKFAKVSRHPRLKFCIYMLCAHVPER